MQAPIPGFGDNYEITQYGKVWSKRSQSFLSPRLSGKGYPQVDLYFAGEHRTVEVHILVAEAFLGPRPEGHEVNHKDHNKLNNHWLNLEYVTRQENQHAYQRFKNPKWEPQPEAPGPKVKRWTGKGRLKATPVAGNGPVLEFQSVRQAVEAGFSASGISLNLSGRLKTHRGHVFERV